MTDPMQQAVEVLARAMQAIVAADRWKGRDTSGEPPEKWHRLRPETQQFWRDEAKRIMDQILGAGVVHDVAAAIRERGEA